MLICALLQLPNRFKVYNRELGVTLTQIKSKFSIMMPVANVRDVRYGIDGNIWKIERAFGLRTRLPPSNEVERNGLLRSSPHYGDTRRA